MEQNVYTRAGLRILLKVLCEGIGKFTKDTEEMGKRTNANAGCLADVAAIVLNQLKPIVLKLYYKM